MTLAIRVDGIAQTKWAFNELPKRLHDKHLKIGLNAAGGVIKNAAVAIVRRDSGLLAKSLGVKLPKPKKNGPLSAVVGARRRFVGPAITVGGKTKILSLRKATKRVVSGGSVQTRKPSRYAHLVEGGHGGPRPARAYPFLSTAVASSGEAAAAKMIAKLQQGLSQEAANLYAGSP